MCPGEVARSYRIHLDYPNVVRDEFGNVGFWTMIEAAVGGLHYFALHCIIAYYITPIIAHITLCKTVTVLLYYR